MGKRKWPKAEQWEIDFVIENVENMSNKEIADKLNRPVWWVNRTVTQTGSKRKHLLRPVDKLTEAKLQVRKFVATFNKKWEWT